MILNTRKTHCFKIEIANKFKDTNIAVLTNYFCQKFYYGEFYEKDKDNSKNGAYLMYSDILEELPYYNLKQLQDIIFRMIGLGLINQEDSEAPTTETLYYFYFDDDFVNEFNLRENK